MGSLPKEKISFISLSPDNKNLFIGTQNGRVLHYNFRIQNFVRKYQPFVKETKKSYNRVEIKWMGVSNDSKYLYVFGLIFLNCDDDWMVRGNRIYCYSIKRGTLIKQLREISKSKEIDHIILIN